MTEFEPNKKDFSLTSWYLSTPRIFDLIDPNLIPSAPIGLPEWLQRGAYLSNINKSFEEWLKTQNIPTLGQLNSARSIKEGIYFTHYDAYYYRLTKTKSKYCRLMHCNLGSIDLNLELQGELQEEHLVSQTSQVVLSGFKPHFLFGLITSIDSKYLNAVPIVVSTMTPEFSKASYIGKNWPNRLEVHIDSIDSFQEVKNVPTPNKNDLKLLERIPELEIKKAIAEIINEQDLDKDWAGERSDFFTTRIKYSGHRISTAMALKGPAQFKPMTFSVLGKAGDQVDRLFTEPAELMILQHCHIIKKEVRGMMRAYATRVGNLKLFCLIDGYDTLRLLRAYKKCGL
ncbi:MAG TPA: hypothetical protein VHE12_11120 [bacterium]|nr:hypothetical protein [bacterium]